MYAFLSKVFGRKKDDRDVPSSSPQVLGPGELLGGRFEAVSPNVSPSAQFSQLIPDINEASKDKGKDTSFSFFKGKWRPASPDVMPTRKLDVLPHLSLNFQETKAISAKPDLGLLFATDQILSDAVIGQRRLNPPEALILVQACSRAIIGRGLETLGIMHPHWYAASHRIQRRVISHFIYLLNLENVTSLPSPASPTSPISAFEAEVNDTFSPHDIAAILRWGLRHVQIEGDSFGTDDQWYKTFLESESAAGYPPKAFSDKLIPLLPTTHLQLLTATLEIFSSLAAHAEVNGTSASKLCMLFGLWLLTAHRVEDKDDWQTFYARWERTGRMLEHLFLSRIRDQSIDQRMPVRLLELVNKYPYNKGLSSPTTDLSLLPHPPFTTRLHDAFFVRIEIELPYGKRKPSFKLHPLLLLADAFSTKLEGEYADLWAKITIASKNGDSSSLDNVFTDDTIRFLSLVSDEPIGHEVKSPTFSLASPVSPHKPSVDESAAIIVGPTTELAPLSSLSNGIGNDWAQFSTSGFLEVSPNIIPLASTLLDTDIEKTIPLEPVTPLSRRSSKRSKAASPSPPRKSLDFSRPGTESPEVKPEVTPESIEEQKNIIRASRPQIIKLDEAFIDFWSDSLLDPITANWPTFIICKFKSSLESELTFGEAQKQTTLQWLVLEQVYVTRTPVASIPVLRPRASSPSSPSASSRKRFSFWSVSRTASTSSGTSQRGKRKDQVGEMGELLEEEPRNETKELTDKMKSPIFKSRKSLDIRSKSLEATRKPVIISEEAKIDEETAVPAMVSGVVIASAAVVITNESPTSQPSLVEEAVTPKAEVDHSTDTLAIEAASTPIPAIEIVVPSPEPTVEGDGIPLSAASPDVVSSLEAKLETDPLEWENPAVEGAAIEREVESQGRVEPDPISVTQASVVDAVPITVEEAGEISGLNAQHGPIVTPLVSEAPISEPEPDVEIEAPVKPDPPTTEESAASELETSHQAMEVAPPVIDHSPLAESEGPCVEVSQPETIEPQSKLQPQAIEAEPMLSPVEDKTDVATGKTSDLAPILSAAQEVDAQEIFQPQSNVVLEAEDVVDDSKDQVDIIATKLEEGTAEHIETKDIGVKSKEDFTSPPVPLDVTSLEPEVENEALVKPLSSILPTSIIEHRPETAPSNEPAAIAECPSETALDGNALASPGVEPQSVSTTPQETGMDVASTSKATVGHEAETEVEARTYGTDALIAVIPATVLAAEFAETEQPVIQAEKGDSTQHVHEAFVETVPLAATEDVSKIDKVIPDVTHEAASEAGNDSLESGTNLNIEPQQEHVTVPDTEDAEILDIHSSLHNPTSVPLLLKPEISLIKAELEAQNQVEVASMGITDVTPIDAKVQPDPSLNEIALNYQDIEAQSRVDDTEDEPIPESDVTHGIESADIDGPQVDDVPASNTKESQNTTQLEPEVDIIVPEPSAITQVEAENILPRIESEGAVSQRLDDIIPIPENVVAFVANVEDQIVAPVDVQPEHATMVVETSCTDELAEASPLPNVEESPETLAPPVEPSYKSSDNEMVGSNIISEVPLDDLIPEIQVPIEAVLVPTTEDKEEPAVPVELDLGAAENMSVPSQELSVNSEPEELVSVAVETEPEPLSTNSTSDDILEVEEQHVLLPSESPDAANIELNGGLARAEPGPEVAAAVVAPVLETREFQAHHSVDGTAEEVHAIVEAPSEPVVVPNEESTATAISSFDDVSALAVEPEQEKASLDGSTNVAISSESFYEPHSTPKYGIVEEEISAEPAKAQLEALATPDAEEGNRTAEVVPQIVLPIMEASPAQIEEDRLVPVAQGDPSLSEAVYAEALDAEPVPREEPAMIVEPDAMGTSIPNPAINADVARPVEVQEDKLDTVPESEPDLPSHEIKTEGSSSIEKGHSVQDPSPSQNPVVVEVQPEAQVMEETVNTDRSVAAVDIQPEAQSSTVFSDTNVLIALSASSAAIVGQSIASIPVVTNAISNESALSGPLHEENHSQQFEVSADSQATVSNGTQDVVPNHESAAEGDDIAESIAEDGALVAAAIPEVVGESIVPNLQYNASGDVNKPEDAVALSSRDIPPAENHQANTTMTTVELDTSPTHTDKLPHELVKDEDDVTVKLDPSVIAADPTSDGPFETIEPSYPLHSTPDAQIDIEPTAEALNNADVADEHERSAMESHTGAVGPVQSDPIMSELANSACDNNEILAEPAAAVIYSIQDRTAVEVKTNSVEEVFTEDQGNTVTSSQREDIFDRGDESDPTTGQVKRDAQIEDHDPAVQVAVSEEANPEESSATIEYSNGHSDINTLSLEPTGGVERIEDADATVPATITDELSTTEGSNVDDPIQGQVEPEAKDDAPDRLEIMPEIDIMATVPTQACAVDKTAAKEPSPILLEPSVEQPEILERIGSPVTESSIVTEAGAGQSNTTEAFEELKKSVEPPEMAETASVVSQPVTAVPGDLSAETVSIAPAEEDPIDSAPLTERPIQDAEASVVESKSVEIFFTAEPSVERESAVSEPPPEELQIDNERIALAEEDLADDPPPTDNPIQEEAEASVAEFEDAVESSLTDKPDTPTVVFESATVVQEGVYIENSGIAQVLIDPLPIDNPVQEAHTTLVEANENPSTAEPSVPERAFVSESTTVPDAIHVDTQSEEKVVDLLTDNPIQEEAVSPVAALKEAVVNPYIAEPSVAEIVPITSEPATLVLEERQTDSVSVAQAEDILDPSPAEPSEPVLPDPVPDELQTEIVNIVQAEGKAYPSTVEPSVAERAYVVSEPTVEEHRIDNDRTTLAEKDLVDHPRPTENSIQEEADAPVAEFKDAVESSTTAVHENSGIAQVLVDPLPTDNPIPEAVDTQSEENVVDLLTVNPIQEEPVDPIAEFKEAVVNPSIAEPSVAEITSVASEPTTVVLEERQTDNVSVAQEDIVDPSPAESSESVVPDPVPEELQTESVSMIQAEVEESPVAERASVVSEPIFEEHQIDNDRIAIAEEDLVDHPPPIENSIPEEADAPVAEFKDAVESTVTAVHENSGIAQGLVDPLPTDNPIQEADSTLFEAIENSSTPKPSVTEMAFASEPTTVPEALQIDTQSEENVVDLPTDNPIQEEAVGPVAEFKEVVNPSLSEPSMAEIVSVPSEPTPVVLKERQTENVSIEDPSPAESSESVFPDSVPEELQPENVGIIQAEEYSSTPEPSVAEGASVVSEPAPEEHQTNNDRIALAGGDLADHSPSENPIQESAPDTSIVVSEPETAVDEGVHIENSGIAQALVDPLPIDNPIQEADTTLVEANEDSSTPEPSVTERVFVSESTTVPEALHVDTQSEEIVVDLPTDNPIQEEAVAPVAEFKEAVVNPSIAEPSVADRSEPTTVVLKERHTNNISIAQAADPSLAESSESVVPDPLPEELQTENVNIIQAEEEEHPTAESSSVAERASVVSEPVPEELQIDDDCIALAEEDLVDHPPPSENPIQEEAPVAEFKGAVESSSTAGYEDIHIANSGIAQVLHPLPTDNPVEEAKAVENSSTAEPSVTETPFVVSESATIPEALQVGSITQAEEHFVDPPTNLIQEEADPVAAFKEAVPSPSIAEPSVVEIASVTSEPATVVLEERQTDNASITQAEDPSPPESSESVVPDPVPKELQTENVSIIQAEEEECLVAERASVVSEPVPKELQIDNDRVAQAEEDLVDYPPPTENPIQEDVTSVAEFTESVESPFTDEPSVADTSLVVVSEPAIVVHEAVQIENGGIAQADSVGPAPLLSHNPIREEIVAPLAESVEADEKPSTAESSVAKIAPVASDPVTVVPEKLEIENVNIAQAAEDSVDSPVATDSSETETASVVSELAIVPEELPIENDSFTQAKQDLADLPLPGNPLQEETNPTLVEFKEAVEDPSAAELSLGGPSIAGEPQIDNDRIATQAEEGLVDPPPPTDNHIQEKTVSPVTEFKDAVEISSTAEPSVTEIATFASEPTPVVSEELRIGNDNIAQPDEDLVNPPPPTDTLVQNEFNPTLVGFKEPVGVLSTDVSPEEPQIEHDSITQPKEILVDSPPPNEPPVAGITSVVSEPVTGSKQLQIESDSIAPAGESLADPLLTDNLIQDEAIAPVTKFNTSEISSTSISEPPLAEIVSVVSEPPTEVPEDLSNDDTSVAPAEDTLIDPPLQAVEEDIIGECTEERGKEAIPETTLVEDKPQSFKETESEALDTHVLNGNGHSTATQETGTYGLEANSAKSASNENNVPEEPKVLESMHPSHPDISSAMPEPQSIADQQ